MTELEYDLVAVGGGTAGLVSAAGASYLGARSAVVEKRALGGDCLWTGCVPSKALVASGRLARDMREADALGLSPGSPGHDFPGVMERMRAARATAARHDDPRRFRDMGVDVHLGAARFLDPHTVEVEGTGRIRSRRFVLATGAEPRIPPVPGLEAAGYLTHVTAFDEDTLPPRLVVLGGGPVGVELAQVFGRLGARVTVVEMDDRILAREDPEAAAALERILAAEGVEVVTGCAAEEVGTTPGGKVVHGSGERRFEADEILVATGRRPVVEGLGLDRAGVELGEVGVRVDATLRTSARSVWAAGDVTGGPQFTHLADHMAKVVVRNALLPFSARVERRAVPRVTYTDPEVAHVGLGEAEARDRGAATWRYELADLDRAVCDASTEGFVKVHADRRGRVVGATILARGAGEMILPLVMAMKHDLSLPDVTDTIFPYPTMNEGVLRAAQEFRRGQLDGLAGRLLRKVVSWLA